MWFYLMFFLACGRPCEVASHAQLTALLDRVRVDENGDVVFEGTNVHVRSGSAGTTARATGRGNVIIGYDEDDGVDLKTGSHNLVVGPFHTYTGNYGLISGRDNALVGDGAAVIAGQSNLVLSRGGATIGGRWNDVHGPRSVALGGRHLKVTALDGHRDADDEGRSEL